MPTHPDKDMAMAAINGMLGDVAPPAVDPLLEMEGGATPQGSMEGLGMDPGLGMDAGGPDVVAALVSENVQLRALVGLGPNDPIPPVPMGPEAGVGGAGELPPV